MTSIATDVRYALRSLGRTPGFTAIAIFTVAVGIGATTAIFSAVHAVVLQPFPFAEPDRVIAIGERFRVEGGSEGLSAVSPGNFNDWRTHGTFFSDIAARRFVSVNVASGEVPERLIGNAVTHTYFAVFGIPAALGRTFTAAEDRPGGDHVVVLSDRLWKRMFGSDADVVGRVVQMDGRSHTVVGVMPPRFDRLTDGPEEFWIPAAFTDAELSSRDGHSMSAVARLVPGVSIEQAAAELQVIFSRVKAETADTQAREGIVASYAAQVIGDSGRRLLVLFGAVALVMLIACGNVAHLLLARGRLRAHEIALRASLGASSLRILQQFFTESLVLATIGGVLGIGIAHIAVPVLLAISPDDVPRLDQAAVNGVVLLFALAATLLSALLSGVVPALRAARVDLRGDVNNGGRTVTKSNDTLRGLLVAAEVALALVLLTGAGLLVRSAIRLQSVAPGFDSTSVLTARVSLPTIGYEAPARVEQAFAGMVDRLSQAPEVVAAAVSSSVPMAPGATNNGLVPEGQTFDPDDFVLGRLGIISDDYFRVFRIPLSEGRMFTSADRRDTERVMILGETAARRLFPGESAIGKRVGCCEAGPDGAIVLKLVIGVVGDVRSDGPRGGSRADFYVPIRQAPPDTWTWLQRTMTVVVRGATGEAEALTSTIRQAVREIDPALPIHSVATMPQRLQTTLARDRFNTVLMVLLGAIGLVLSMVGIYGVISCFVAQRRRELAIRVALGARSRNVVLMVLNQGMRPVWAGIVIGVLTAAAASQALSTYVYGVTTHDPLTFASVVVVLVAAAFVANALPARAAARVDPAELLVN